jgi:hypothetical protein
MSSHLRRGHRYLLTRQWNRGRAICQSGTQSAAPGNTNETRDNNKEWKVKTDPPGIPK